MRKLEGYKIGYMVIKIMCYADDAVLIWKRRRCIFDTMATNLKSRYQRQKLSAWLHPECKVEIDNNIIHEQMMLKYLSIEISGYGDFETELRG